MLVARGLSFASLEAVKEITIVGGGLAGLSLGISLRRHGVPVTLHEAGRYPRHRVCGEFISGVGRQTLERLGIEHAFRDANRLQSTRWLLGGKPVLDGKLPVAALGISRHRLDLRLARMFEEAGGDLRTQSRRAPAAEEGVVWTAGRPVEPESDWLGLKVHMQGLERSVDLEMHVGRGGYVGLAPVEEGRVNVCGLFRRKRVRAKGSELLLSYLEENGLSKLAHELREAERDEGSFLGVSAFRLGRQSVEEGICVLGDAESMIPPFTGNGMSMAFEAADSAVDPLISWVGSHTSWAETLMMIRGALAQRFRRRLFTARVFHPFLLAPLGRNVLSLAARSRLLPFGMLFRSLR